MNRQNKGRAIWRNRDFLLLWSGQTISMLGTNVSAFALPLLVLLLTHSAAQAGFVAAVRELPYLLLSLPAGALIDRWDRKAVMIRCDLLRWLALGSVPMAFALGRLTLPHLYGVAFVEGAANVLFSLAQISALPQVVSPDQLADAYALDQTTEYAGPLIGPSLGAFIISLASVPEVGAMLAYLVDSVSYIVSVLSLLFIRASFQTPRERLSAQGLFRDVIVGLRFLWREPRLRALLLLTTVVNFLQSPITLTLIVLGQGVLHLSVQTLGFIVSAGGIGGVLGSVIAPWMRKRLRVGQIIRYSVWIWTVAALVLALTPWSVLLPVGCFLISFIWPTYGVTVVTYRLSLAPDQLQGRVNSAFRCFSFGSEPLGKALAGLLFVVPGPRVVLDMIAIGFVLIAIVVSLTPLRKT